MCGRIYALSILSLLTFSSGYAASSSFTQKTHFPISAQLFYPARIVAFYRLPTEQNKDMAIKTREEAINTSDHKTVNEQLAKLRRPSPASTRLSPLDTEDKCPELPADATQQSLVTLQHLQPSQRTHHVPLLQNFPVLRVVAYRFW